MSFDYTKLGSEKNPGADDADFQLELQMLGENALVAAAKLGQRAAFDRLWQPYAERILRTTYRITWNQEDAKDALQDSLLSAFAHIRNFDGKSSFSTWLTRIAINSSLMIVRKRRATPELSLSELGDGAGDFRFTDVSDHGLDPETHWSYHERAEILRTAIRALRPVNRMAIELQKLCEYSVKETAERMGISLAAAKSRLHQARVALRRSLKSEAPRNRRATAPPRFLSAA